MANDDHIAQLTKGVAAWNAWREENRNIQPDLRGAYLNSKDLTEVNFSGAWLDRAELRGAYLRGAKFIGAHLFGAFLNGADLRRADLGEAKLIGANLSEADLEYASLSDADITNADLTGCRIYGVSASELKLSNETKQQNLIITKRSTPPQPEITVDDIEVAQFIYLMLNNQKNPERHRHDYFKGGADPRPLHNRA